MIILMILTIIILIILLILLMLLIIIIILIIIATKGTSLILRELRVRIRAADDWQGADVPDLFFARMLYVCIYIYIYI